MRKRDLQNKAAVQAAVRQVADVYLSDPNINSVGVGYKTADGKPTDTLALQFTVGRKFAPEALEEVETRPIPESITANGITFATDVVERDFERHPVAVATNAKAERKRRLDPMMPGVSVGNVSTTAGTLGCLVKEDASGEPRMLSNWHVFSGSTGKIGDPIVQPGSFDDNRTTKNVCGKLERSFLGLAGDCAIASISARRVTPEILGLRVAVRRIGNPELGDRVIKSGRTTAVTYGLVTRIHTITKLDYGAAGERQIGGFEIGPDKEHPAEHGEISMRGDSGSAWMAVTREGGADDMMLGLHFAGETSEPAEYALACYTSSVFEKLEIGPIDLPVEEVVSAIESIATGFNRDFLPNHRLALPTTRMTAIKKDYAPTKTGALVRDYTHFSLAMSASRRFCRWVAWNIDGSALQALPRVHMRFKLDGAYDAKYQVGDELYGEPANVLDRGHIARRADLVWGSDHEAEQGNIDSFFFTNITPQLDDFNQSTKHGLWGELENAVFEDVDIDDLRVSVFGGPIFKDTDFAYRNVLVPRSFWKLIAYAEGGILKAKAFVLTQEDLEARLESLGLEPFKLYQVSLAHLTTSTGLGFGNLAQADTMPPAPEAVDAPAVRRIDARSEIVAH
jgi:endonuclease G, mitochondrial